METWSQLDSLEDGQLLNAKTLNGPLAQLGSRTDYLKRKVGSMGTGESVVLNNVPVSSSASVGDVVFMDPSSHSFSPAQARMDLYDAFMAADDSFPVGVLISSGGTSGNVLVYGKVSLPEHGITKSIVEEGETFRSGRYFLSSTAPGRITAYPSGPVIYIGSFSTDDDSSDFSSSLNSSAFINPQFLDIGTSHIHRAYALRCRPVGEVSSGAVVGYSALSGGSSPLRISFRGTWTGSGDTQYSFWMGSRLNVQETAQWGSVSLSWTKTGAETGSGTCFIHAPDTYFPVDDGLEAAVAFPLSDGTNAYSGLSLQSRQFGSFDMPEDATGWTSHRLASSASQASGVFCASVTGSKNSSLGDTLSVSIPAKIYSVSFETASVEDVRVDVVLSPSGSAQSKMSFIAVQNPSSSGTSSVTYVQKAASTDLTVAALASAVTKYVSSVIKTGTNFAFADGGILYLVGTRISEMKMSATVLGSDSGASSDDSVVSSSNMNADSIRMSSDSSSSIFIAVAGGSSENPYGNLIATTVDNLLFREKTLTGGLSGMSLCVFTKVRNDSAPKYAYSGTFISINVHDESPSSAYDYSVGMDQALSAHYPPVPAAAASVVVNGVEQNSKALFPGGYTVEIGQSSIHWADLSTPPFPEGIADFRTATVSSSQEKTGAIHFVRGFQGSTGPVTSLRAADGAPIRITECGTGTSASVGDLEIDADMSVIVGDAGLSGYNAVKSGVGGRLLTGPVVEKIVAGPGVYVSSRGDAPSGQGTVTVSLDDGSYRGSFDEIALENAKQEKIGMFPYVKLLGWASGSSVLIPSAFTASLRVPITLSKESTYLLRLYATVFGEATYSASSAETAGVTLDYSVLPDYTASPSGTDLSYSNLKTGIGSPSDGPYLMGIPLCTSSGATKSYTAFDPVLVTNDQSIDASAGRVVYWDIAIPGSSMTSSGYALRPGYMVAVRIARAYYDVSGSTNYPGAIGFLNLRWALKEV